MSLGFSWSQKIQGPNQVSLMFYSCCYNENPFPTSTLSSAPHQNSSEILLGRLSTLKYISQSLAKSNFKQNVKVSCQHQKSASHNLSLIPHLAHINNPPLWTEVILSLPHHSPSSPPSSAFDLHRLYSNPGHPALRKHSTLIFLSKFKCSGFVSACPVSGFADSPACWPT